MEAMIHNITPEARQFIEEWNNSHDYIIAHTSGSTGKPKEIHLLKSDMRLSAEATCRYFGIGPDSRLVLPLSPGYIAGKMMIVRALISGAELWIEEPSMSPLKRDYGIVDLLPVVPSQVTTLLQSPYITGVRNLIVGGGALDPETEQKLAACQLKAYATYGMTETCSHVALRDITAGDEHFHALPGISFKTDERECLVIEAPHYSFRSLTTNDTVELIDNSRFRWKGRYDNVINSGGVKLHPEEIEKKLSRFIDRPFYIAGRPSKLWGEEAVLYIEGCDIDRNYIMEKARSVLDRYSVPKDVIVVPNFSRTDSGKIKRL